MKQVLYLILFFAFSTGAIFAQKSASQGVMYMNPWAPYYFKSLDMNVIDSGNIIIMYAMNAIDINNSKTYDDFHYLEIGSSLSKYYSYYTYINDSLMSAEKKKHPKATNNETPAFLAPRGKLDGWSEYVYSEYFKDFSKNTLTEYARMPLNFGNNDSWYSETTPLQNWKISDDTLTVAGYLCQKATCKFRGRDYTAWFSGDIPINNGPWKFGGLPGLILKVYDKDKLYTFECVGIENHKQKYPVKMHKVFAKYRNTDRQKLWKLKKNIQENYWQLTANAIGIVFRAKDTELAPYNPLELEP